MLAKYITSKTKCNTCGGLGHASSQVLEDGTIMLCPTKRMQTKPDANAVTETSNDGFDMSELTEVINSLQQQYETAQQEINELQEALAAQQKPFVKKRVSSNKNNTKQPHTFSLSSQDDSTEDVEDDMEDDASDCSAHSTISNPQSIYANALKKNLQFKRTMKK